MKAFNDKIKIYKFDGLTELKHNYNYDDYLIIIYGEDEGSWYQFCKDEMTDSYNSYLSTNLGITNPDELQNLMVMYNKTLNDGSYEVLKATKVKVNKWSNWATTDKGIKLTTKGYKKTGGMLWYKINDGGNKDGSFN